MALKRSILVVEDDADINALVCEILRRGGYEATAAYSGTEALLRLEGRFDLVLLDRMLPGMSGEEVLGALRQKSTVPVIMLSAREAAKEKAELLRLGADDYLTKPFDDEELLARIEAALRRGGAAPNEGVLVHDHIALDRAARAVKLHGEPLALTAREFDILALLMESPAKVFTRGNIYESVWDEPFMGDENTVNVHVSNLRAKLGEPEVIRTVWGIGFTLAQR